MQDLTQQLRCPKWLVNFVWAARRGERCAIRNRKGSSMMNFPKLFGFMALGLVFAAMPMLGACAPTEIDWSEEVELHDGKIIVVKRHEEIGATGFPLSHRGSRKYWHFCYAPMNIIWKSKPEYYPEVFDIVDGKAYVRVTIANCELCMLHGYPETSALYFVWEHNAWKKIDYKEFPVGLRVNMLGGTHYDDDGSRDVRGLVTIEQKEHLDGEMYWLMRKKPEIVGLNDVLIHNPVIGGSRIIARDACKACKGIRGQTTSTSEVFLPATSRDCK